MRRAAFRVGGSLAVLAILVISATACRIPSPLTYPLLLTPPVDAMADVHRLLGNPPPPADSPTAVARQLAVALTRQSEGCEVLTVAQVIWVAPAATSSAAIEVRGLCDDSVAGLWYEITITGNDQVGWVVSSASRQDICARGVSGPVCV